jgi:AcrR family transcriptional regulator
MPKKQQAGTKDGPTQGTLKERPQKDARERILEAAMAEFSHKGFGSARVGNIADRANVSQQLLFHYFVSKRGLQQAAIEHFMNYAESTARPTFSSLAQRLQMNYEQIIKDRDAARLLIWESLELEETDIIEDQRRIAIFRVLIAAIAQEQSEGVIPAILDTELSAMTVLGLTILPQVLPMYVRSIFGLTPNDPKFIAKWKKHLGQLGELIAPSQPPDPARKPARRAQRK